MKTITLRLAFAVILAIFFCVFSCSDPDEEIDSEPDDNEQVPDDPDELLESLTFLSSSKVAGPVPTATKSFRTKTNSKDTIYLISGNKHALRIAHPQDVISGIFIAGVGGNFYYDVPVTETEETDTVSVIILDAAPGEIELPYDIPVEIIPYDNNKNPIDVIERIVTVEEAVTNGCDILQPRPGTLNDTAGVWEPEWFWFSTMVFDGNGELKFLNVPGKGFVTNTVYEGCCDPARAGGKCHPLSTTLNASASVSISYSIESETFAFFSDGTFARQTYERKRNFDPETTNWCTGTAGYKNENIVVSYFGNHDYSSGDSEISYGTTDATCDLCGYGSRGGNLKYTCHTMTISVGDMEGGRQNEVRTYVRNPLSVWYN